MSRRSRFAIVGMLTAALGAAPGAEARPAADAVVQAQPPRAKVRLASMRLAPSTIRAGARLRVRGRVVNMPRRKRAKLTFTLRRRPNAQRYMHLKSKRLKRARGSTRRRFKLRIKVPGWTRPGTYRVRGCVKRAGSTRRGSCRSKRLRIAARRRTAPAGSLARHSLRPPLTGENFYFVMADRFKNGNADNDTGGIAGDSHAHGFDPARKGYFHGGDLEGLLSEIDYIQGLGTTAIWLTPSFKNKAVQGTGAAESAGYHGYWVTDFTQIDPHFGTNEDLRKLVDEAHDRGIKVFFDIITNHSADVITYAEGEFGYVPKDTGALSHGRRNAVRRP